jgi:hypothetical protein
MLRQGAPSSRTAAGRSIAAEAARYLSNLGVFRSERSGAAMRTEAQAAHDGEGIQEISAVKLPS